MPRVVKAGHPYLEVREQFVISIIGRAAMFVAMVSVPVTLLPIAPDLQVMSQFLGGHGQGRIVEIRCDKLKQ